MDPIDRSMEELLQAIQQIRIPVQAVQLLPDMVGRSRYEVRKAIYRGATEVAVKLIPFSFVSGEELLQVKKEVLAMEECKSDWVVHLYGVCVWDMQLGIVMELMDSSLAAYAYGPKKGQLDYFAVVNVGLQLAIGLTVLHDRGFIHRDIKPENILVNGSCKTFKYTDFGLTAAVLTSCVPTEDALRGAGTPHYMSPEQINPRATVTRATDIWALGAVLLALIKHAVPWPGEWKLTQFVFAVAMHREKPSIPSSLPRSLQDLLSQCFEYDAKNRPTAPQLVVRLTQILDELRSESSVVPPRFSAPVNDGMQTVDVMDPPSPSTTVQAQQVIGRVHMEQGLAMVREKTSNMPLQLISMLDFCGNNIGTEGVMALAAVLPQLSQLTHLNLSGNNIGVEGAKALAAVLPQMSQLTGLDLYNNCIGSEGAQVLAAAFLHMSQLTHLNLSNNSVGAEGVKALAPALPLMSQLIQLDLYINNIGAEGTKALATVVPQMSRLAHLNLSLNNIGVEGVQALAVVLPQVPQVTHLNLSNNNIGAEGVKALAAALPQMTQLTHLNLAINGVGDEGMELLAAVCPQLSQLAQLDLAGDNVGDDGAKALAAVLPQMPQLTQLDLSYNSIGDGGKTILNAALSQVPRLELLDGPQLCNL